MVGDDAHNDLETSAVADVIGEFRIDPKELLRSEALLDAFNLFCSNRRLAILGTIARYIAEKIELQNGLVSSGSSSDQLRQEFVNGISP